MTHHQARHDGSQLRRLTEMADPDDADAVDELFTRRFSFYCSARSEGGPGIAFRGRRLTFDR